MIAATAARPVSDSSDLLSDPKAAALAFEDDPNALRYQRGAAQRLWEKVNNGTSLNGLHGRFANRRQAIRTITEQLIAAGS